jgi:hypothetical protein
MLPALQNIVARRHHSREVLMNLTAYSLNPWLLLCCVFFPVPCQVLKLLPSSRVLLVAPSNLAADLLAQRLLSSGRPKSEMMRVCAFARPSEDLPTDLREVCNWDDGEGAFKLPSLATVTQGRVRVVVVTALMASKVSSGCCFGKLLAA